MDEIDHNLLEAWERIGARLKADGPFRERRVAMAKQVVAGRPVRAWCMVLRASDTRILNATEGTTDAYLRRRRHVAELRGAEVRELCAPLWLKWPGVRMADAAAKLGVNEAQVWKLVNRGVLRARYEAGAAYGVPCRQNVPLVWTPGWVDPNARLLRPPNQVWGATWRWLSKKVPDAYVLRATRVPRHWTLADGAKHPGGWDWLCPGRLKRNGQLSDCGRRVHVLYGPVPVMTIAQVLGIEPPIEVPLPRPDGYSFACRVCWNVRHDPAYDPRRAWNVFVQQISGGILKGREVAMPEGLEWREPLWKKRREGDEEPREAEAVAARDKSVRRKQSAA